MVDVAKCVQGLIVCSRLSCQHEIFCQDHFNLFKGVCEQNYVIALKPILNVKKDFEVDAKCKQGFLHRRFFSFAYAGHGARCICVAGVVARRLTDGGRRGNRVSSSSIQQGTPTRSRNHLAVLQK